jgi:hypothetical protein
MRGQRLGARRRRVALVAALRGGRGRTQGAGEDQAGVCGAVAPLVAKKVVPGLQSERGRETAALPSQRSSTPRMSRRLTLGYARPSRCNSWAVAGREGSACTTGARARRTRSSASAPRHRGGSRRSRGRQIWAEPRGVDAGEGQTGGGRSGTRALEQGEGGEKRRRVAAGDLAGGPHLTKSARPWQAQPSRPQRAQASDAPLLAALVQSRSMCPVRPQR